MTRLLRPLTPILLATLALLATACGSTSPTEGKEAGVWCRATTPMKVMLLDGSGKYSIHTKEAPGYKATATDEKYEMVEEEGKTHFRTWIGEQKYSNELTELVQSKKLVLDGNKIYHFVAAYAVDYKVDTIKTCTAAGGK